FSRGFWLCIDRCSTRRGFGGRGPLGTVFWTWSVALIYSIHLMRVCIVDDIIENARYVRRILVDYETHLFNDPREALEFVRANPIDILITDQKMPELTGIELVRTITETTEDFVTLVISAYTDSDDLIDAVNSNLIYKYVVKPFSPQVLLQHVQRAADHLTLRRSNAMLQRRLRLQNEVLRQENSALRRNDARPFDVFIGEDPVMEKIKELTRIYAPSAEPVLITGETGTGKELLARAVHESSQRRNDPFLPINCSALQESMLESELFGHAKGAFTGAERAKAGLLEAADGGTLFLDEIGDMPAVLQAKLLRAIQFGTFIPVGSTDERRVDVRFISATNKNLREAVSCGMFRADLFYRLNPLHIHLPPLRERRGDIVPILGRLAEIRNLSPPPLTDAARTALLSYPFPGNVRELKSVLERLVLAGRLRDNVSVDVGALNEALALPKVDETEGRRAHSRSAIEAELRLPQPDEVVSLAAMVEAFEKRVIHHVLMQENDNISRSARRLGMSRQGLKNKVRTN
ncbi:MAG: sigma-54 dependent transcriptional regulator, partial [Spirochaetales bacterium]|nr:sigma-54 dependent transcriptional regulator [Spirochaetales bacterium]